MQARHDRELVGQTLAGRYDILAVLGSGGMGSVYRARDRELDEMVALKVIRESLAGDPDMLERFRHEVKLARRVTHVNIARMFELGADAGLTFCTMELVEGESLRHRLRRAGKLAIDEAAAIVLALCDGLVVAHAAGVIHRDIKPENVLVASTGRVVLVDFGIAALGIEHTRELVGTPEYMAPEQAHGEPPTPASDIYALGLVLYEMVVGERAFPGSGLPVLLAKQDVAHVACPPSVPAALATVIARATARDRDTRLASATELAKALAPWLKGRAGTLVLGPLPSPDDELAIATVIVRSPTGDGRRLHVAMAVHEELLRRLVRVPQIRALPRPAGVDLPGATAVDLHAGDSLAVAIHDPRLAAPLRIDLPLSIGEIELAAELAATAIADVARGAHAAPSGPVPDAHDLLLQARLIARRGFDGVAHAFALVQRAHAVAPDDPRISAALAMFTVRSSVFGRDRPDDLTAALELVRAALARAPDLAESHVAAAHLVLHTGDPGIAAAHFRTAITCSPWAAEAHEGLGRMLLEAGYIEAASARLQDALAISPDLVTVRWEIARAYALEQQWELHDAHVAPLRTPEADRPLQRFRFAWWRGDLETMRTLRPAFRPDGPTDPYFFTHLWECVFDGAWPRHRETLLAYLRGITSQSQRRHALMAQMIAETAGSLDDIPTTLAMLDHATKHGLFDLHWFDRCPNLERVRPLPEAIRVRERVKRRAEAVLDALYGDVEPSSLSETVSSKRV